MLFSFLTIKVIIMPTAEKLGVKKSVERNIMITSNP